MPRTCTVCAHELHHEINVALVSRDPRQGKIEAALMTLQGPVWVADRFHLPEQAVKTHRFYCLGRVFVGVRGGEQHA